MKLKISRGTTSKIVRLFIQDSTSATGAGLSGLTNASSGLLAYYIAEGAATATAITLAGGTVGTWSSGGFKEVDAVHMPGVYELGLPNAALASGNSTLVYLQGAANMVPTLLEIELDAIAYQDAVRAGLGALPNAAAGTAGGLPTATNSAGQVQHDMTQAVPTSNTAQTLGDALNAARAGSFGKWVLSGTTLALYAPDGSTIVRTFTLDNANNPTTRA